MNILPYVEQLSQLRTIKRGVQEAETQTIQEQCKRLKEQIETALLQTTDSQVLKQIIEWETDQCFMPIPTMIHVYKRLLELEPDSQNILTFAHYLFLYGPDWDEDATEMVHLAKTGKAAEAVQLAMRVE